MSKKEDNNKSKFDAGLSGNSFELAIAYAIIVILIGVAITILT